MILSGLNKKEKFRAEHLKILWLTALVFAVDQTVKTVIAVLAPLDPNGSTPILWRSAGDWIRIIHVRNKNLSFSLGRNLPDEWKFILFVLVAGLALIAITVYFLRDRSMPRNMRIVLALVLGGGYGNMFDRVFRPEGVVDFIDVKMPFSINFLFIHINWVRWPTFNIADSMIVVGIIVMMIMMLFGIGERGDGGKKHGTRR